MEITHRMHIRSIHNPPDHMRRKVFRIVALLTLLTACGGSGGSDPDPFDSINLATVPYNGSTEPSSLSTNENEFYAVQLAIESPLIFDVITSFWINQQLPLINTEISGSGGGKAKTEITDSEILVKYLAFTESGLTVTGQTKQNQPPRPNQVGEIDGFIELSHLVLASDDFEITIDGIIFGSFTNEGVNRLVADVVIVDNDTGQSVNLVNFIIEYEKIYHNLGPDQTYTSINGQIYDSDRGYIFVETLRPMLDLAIKTASEILSSDPGGLITIRGGNDSIQFASLNQFWAAILKDENNNEIYESGKRISWSALNETEPPIELEQSNLPIVNPGNEFYVNTGNEVILHGLFSDDPDNQYLNYSWQLLDGPNGHSLPDQPLEGAFLNFMADVQGEYLFRLTASDGIYEVDRGLKLSVGGFAPPRDKPILPTSAALEVRDSSFGLERTFMLNAKSIYGPDKDESEIIWNLSKPNTSTDNANLVLNQGSLLNTFVADPDIGGSYRVNGLSFSVGAAGYDFFLDKEIGRYIHEIETIDYDMDGIDDYIAIDRAGAGVWSIQVWRGAADGTYDFYLSVPSGEEYLTLGDLNSDGLIDVVSSDAEDVYISYQNINGDLEAPVSLEYTTSCIHSFIRDIAIADSNGDGLNDLWIAEGCGSEVRIWEQNQSGFLTYSISINVGDSMFDARFANLNSDNLLDLVFAENPLSGRNGTANIAINNSTGFTIINSFENQALKNAPYVEVGDLDEDGVDEVIHIDGRRIAILKANSTGQFEQFDDMYLSSWLSFKPSGAVGDFDMDGDNDFILVGVYAMFAFVNQGSSFHPSFFRSTTSSLTTNAANVMDYNKDGYNDIVLFGDQKVRLYTNSIRSFSTAVSN